MDPGPGDPDVEQAAFLLDLGRLARLADRQEALLEGRQEDGVPFEPLRPVIGEQLDAGAGGPVRLGRRPLAPPRRGTHPRPPPDRPPRPRVRSRAGRAGRHAADEPPHRAGPSRGRSRGPAARSRPVARRGLGGSASAPMRPSRPGASPRPPGAMARAPGPVTPPGPRAAAPSGPHGRRDRPADLGAPEEALAAELERDPRRSEGGFEAHELAVRPHEDGRRLGRDPLADEPSRLGGHGPLLVEVRRELADRRGGSARAGRHEPLRRSDHRPWCPGQEPVREPEDLRRAPVVRLETDDLGRRVPPGEPGQPLGRGAGEGVDRLVLVADDGQVLPAAEPGVEDGLLEGVRVLVLVDAEPAVAVAHLGGDRRLVLEEADGHLEHVLEVDPSDPLLGPLVAPVEGREQAGGQGTVVTLPVDRLLVGGAAGSGAPSPTRSRRPGRGPPRSGSRRAGSGQGRR